MSKTRVSFSISDKELEETLETLMKDRIRETCIDSVKNIISQRLKDEIRVKAIRVTDQMPDYTLNNIYKEEVKKQVSSRISDVWGDINKDIRKAIDESVQEALSKGRFETFIHDAVEKEIQAYVSRVFKQFAPESKDTE